MDDALLPEFSQSQDVLQPLLVASNSSTIEHALEILIEIARTDFGRTDLSSKNILPSALQLVQALPYPSGRELLLLSLKLVRNLCGGAITNQNKFIDLNGVGVVMTVLSSARCSSGPDCGMIRMCLQVLANVSLADENHQRAIWDQIFPDELLEIARVQSRSTCDPLCMIIYTCCDGSSEVAMEFCVDGGNAIVAEIVRTCSVVGFGENWLKLLLSRICLEESQFQQLFSKLYAAKAVEGGENTGFGENNFTSEQAYLMSIASGILNEQIGELTIRNDMVLFVFGLFKRCVGIIDSVSGCKSGLPTGSTATDILGYSLIILRDICAQDGLRGCKEDSQDVVDMLISSGLLELLLCMLRDLEPPSIIRKAIKQGDDQEATSSHSGKPCPYKGFRRDIVAVIGNCAYRRKRVQDHIREKDGILLMLQHCVTDDDNPFLREWGIWSFRNLLEGNLENQRVVAELEIQGSVDMPEIAGLGLRVEVDQKTRRAKLVNASSS